jgi:hypothetical protein
MTYEYIAGYLDGEGHVRVHPSGKGKQVTVSISNTHHASLAAMQAFLADEGLPTAIYKRALRERHKPCFTLSVTGHEVQQEFLRRVLPYLHIKAEDARKVIEFISKKTWQIDFSEKQISTALAEYAAGASLREVERRHHISSRCLRGHARRRQIPLRNQRDAIQLWRASLVPAGT